MAEEILRFYNSLTPEQQKEAYDFVIYLYNKNNLKDEQTESMENPVMALLGAMSAEEASELRNERIKFKEAEF